MIDYRLLDKAFKFLYPLNIPIVYADAQPDTFIPGVWIEQGKVYCDITKLECIGDLFHEVGHWAVTPGCYRDRWHGDTFDLPDDEFHELMNDLVDTENPLYRHVIDGDELATIAWSYAAAIQCEIDPVDMHLKHHFQGSWGDECAVLSLKRHAGVSNLIRIGMLESRDWFPVLQKWVQD